MRFIPGVHSEMMFVFISSGTEKIYLTRLICMNDDMDDRFVNDMIS